MPDAATQPRPATRPLADIYRDHFPYASDREREIIERCLPFTQGPRERLFGLVRAVDYVVRHRIPGSFVECGVWKGGSVMAMALALATAGEQGRDLYLLDTFEGMPPAGPEDVDFRGAHADSYVGRDPGVSGTFNVVPLDEVRANVAALGLDGLRFHFVKGLVEQTVPAEAPSSIALLRLDTDYYASTKHEMEHLFPRLSPGGVLIVDDYGHFAGSQRAVDEVLAATGARILLNRIDYTAVIGVRC